MTGLGSFSVGGYLTRKSEATIKKGEIVTQSSKQSFLKSTSLIAMVFVAACSQDEVKFRQAAGHKQSQMGLLVYDVKDTEVRKLASVDGVEVRALYGGMYEVFNADEKQIKAALGNKNVQKNEYLENLLPHVSSKARISQIDPDSCKKDATQPEFRVKMAGTGAKKLKETGVLDLGKDDIKIEAFDALASATQPSDLTFMWIVNGPHGSKFEQMTLDSANIDITPDRIGSYTLILVAQNKAGGCGVGQLEFGVTTNAKFKGPTAPRAFEPADAERFKHLTAIGAENAWTKSRGKGVVVGIVDSGVNFNHPDLSQNIVVNTNETPDNGIDDDNNGLVDDYVGYDFAMGDSSPLDDNMHGTHVAGLTASAVSGVAPDAKILVVKAMSSLGGGDIGSIQAGIIYAVDRGAQIINLSLGTDAPQAAVKIKAALDYAEKHGVLVLAAAGNGDARGVGYNLDDHPTYPASISSKALLAVAATDLSGTLTGYSNFSAAVVQVAAPGGDEKDGLLMSTGFDPEADMYVGAAGTSMATPVTAGVAALVKSQHPEFSNVDVKARIMETVTAKNALQGKVVTGGMVSAAKAVGL